MKEPEEESNREPQTASIAIDYTDSDEEILSPPKQHFSIGGLLTIGALGVVAAGLVLPGTVTCGCGSPVSKEQVATMRHAEIEAAIRAFDGRNNEISERNSNHE